MGRRLVSLLLLFGLMGCVPPSMAGGSGGGLTTLEQKGGGWLIRFPMVKSAVEFGAPGFTLQQEDAGRPYYFFANEASGLNVSFMFDQVDRCRSSRECRDFGAEALGQDGSRATKLTSGQLGDVFVYEYTAPPVGDMDLRQHNMNAHFVNERLWLDVHLSKVNYQPNDRELFEAAVRAIHVTPL